MVCFWQVLSFLCLVYKSFFHHCNPPIRIQFTIIGHTSFLLGSVFWILNIAFRLTGTVWVAKDLAASGQLAGWFQTWSDWSNLIFAFYMVLSYFGIGCLNYSLKEITGLPAWIPWFCIAFGFLGAVSYPLKFPLYVAPLMLYLPLILTGLFIIVKIKR